MHQNNGHLWSGKATISETYYASDRPVPVIALHCSGADGSTWRKLTGALGPWFAVIAPNFLGCADRGNWSGERAFSLADEARPMIELIDELDGRVHIVGHSYGGGVALKIASARPSSIASLTLYEPSAFHLLRQIGARGEAALAEIEGVASAIADGLVSGAYQEAASRFVDYWNGPGSWSAMRPSVREALVRWLPKAPLDFRALINEATPLASYDRIACPVHLIRGQNARGPSRLIVDELARVFPHATRDVVPGAGHMGPLTHHFEVNACIGGYVRAATVRASMAAAARPIAA
jgi:pimeloyl-ACP methyl ester carboxylesterase